MSEKILLVDDEPAVLQGFQRLLHSEFQVTTAVGGKVGLLLVKSQGPFAVVVSDMRMPEMDGIEFLRKVMAAAPDTVRIMLTGNSDQQTAIDAVNQGSIFRFLSKPCSKETLSKALTDGLAQYRVLCAEKELLEKTLRGTIYILTEVLSVVSPAAFSRAARVRRYVQHVAKSLSLPGAWKYEVAAMLSQLGCVTLDPETIEVMYSGGELAPEEQAQFLNHPQVAQELLKNIPRMEAIAWMIAHQNQPLPGEWNVNDREMQEMRLGAQLIRAALAFDLLLRKGRSRLDAAHFLTRKFGDLDMKIVEAMIELEPEVAGLNAQTLPLAQLTAGMVLEQEVRTRAGVLVAAKDQELTAPLLIKLRSFAHKKSIDETVAVSPPKVA
jgi:response regulator RpfG family c-di-GMP phosphodiesterase